MEKMARFINISLKDFQEKCVQMQYAKTVNGKEKTLWVVYYDHTYKIIPFNPKYIRVRKNKSKQETLKRAYELFVNPRLKNRDKLVKKSQFSYTVCNQ